MLRGKQASVTPGSMHKRRLAGRLAMLQKHFLKSM
jgi:hypothetical protein